MGKLLYDINAQPNIFHRDFFKTWENPPNDSLFGPLCTVFGKKAGVEHYKIQCIIPRKDSWQF